MRVIVAHHGYGEVVAGAEQMAVRTAEALAARGHGVDLLTGLDRPAVLGAGGKPDAVHLVDAVDARFGVAAVELARECGALLGVTPASAPSFWEDRRAGVRLCDAADVLFCLTRAEFDALRSIGVSHAEPWFLPQAPALRGTGEGESFRARHGLVGPIVLFLGRKARSKGYRELLAAGPEVWRGLPEVSFVFAGSAWDPDCAAAFERHRDRRVLDLGRVSDAEKEDALAACSLLCLPTSEDVSPLVFAEAWSYGKPVISGEFPGVGEVVRDGRDGLVVPPCPPRIAAAILSLLRDPGRLRRFGAEGRERAAASMSWAGAAATIERAYRSLASPSRPPNNQRTMATGDDRWRR